MLIWITYALLGIRLNHVSRHMVLQSGVVSIACSGKCVSVIHRNSQQLKRNQDLPWVWTSVYSTLNNLYVNVLCWFCKQWGFFNKGKTFTDVK